MGYSAAPESFTICCADGSQLTWADSVIGQRNLSMQRPESRATPRRQPRQRNLHPIHQPNGGEPVNHLPIDPAAHSSSALAALPQLQPRPRLPTMPKQPQLPNPLAIPPQDRRHPRFTAMPNLRPHVDGRPRVDANLTSWPPFL